MADPIKLPRTADLLEGIVKKIAGDKIDAFATLRKDWPRIAGSALAQNSHIAAFKDGVITVAVESSVWLTEAHLRRNEIRTKIAAALPGQEIRDVKVRLK